MREEVGRGFKRRLTICLLPSSPAMGSEHTRNFLLVRKGHETERERMMGVPCARWGQFGPSHVRVHWHLVDRIHMNVCWLRFEFVIAQDTCLIRIRPLTGPYIELSNDRTTMYGWPHHSRFLPVSCGHIVAWVGLSKKLTYKKRGSSVGTKFYVRFSSIESDLHTYVHKPQDSARKLGLDKP